MGSGSIVASHSPVYQVRGAEFDERAGDLFCRANAFMRGLPPRSAPTNTPEFPEGRSWAAFERARVQVGAVLQAACRDSAQGAVGVETVKVISGSVAEEITRRSVLSATVVALGGALVSGGSLLAIGAVGAFGYMTLPTVARWAAEELTVSAERLGKATGSELRRWFDGARAP
jgi:hypothetical protein